MPSLELPKLSNKSSPFRGKIIHAGFEGYTWVSYPHVENPASLDVDPKGRIFVAEANRFKFGVQDLRGVRYMVARDFQSTTLEDRLRLYQDFSSEIPMDWYTSVPERILRLQDTDGNGVADERTVYSDDFNETLDGIGFSILAEPDALYFSCIPALRRLTDSNDDGIADTNEKIVNGFGVRISFTGHDLHGIIRGPDGRLYFSVGDRGYHVVDGSGEIQAASGRGAVFRCDSDGSNFEVVAHGLRNPQELAFDNNGNLFTFDNNGDIGDKSRIVYVLENSDSGWDMSHQSAHQYVKDLDWGDFHISKSVWVGEEMFDTFSEDQPQWVFSPVAHLGNGPSGVAWVTGEALPKDMRNSFLVTDYKGSPSRCKVWIVKLQQNGAGFQLAVGKTLVDNVGISDVAQGYDGNLYFADYGGGWSVNKNGSVQAIRPKDQKLQSAGNAVAQLMSDGFGHRSLPELSNLLDHADQRIRQSAQFATVEKGESAVVEFSDILADTESSLQAKLHSVWGLGQLARNGFSESVTPLILKMLESKEIEIRANAARVAGDSNLLNLVNSLIGMLNDPSPRVVSLAALSLGRIGSKSDPVLVSALLHSVEQNKGADFDPVLRHSFISALDRIASPEQLIALARSESEEQRLCAVILLRRTANNGLMTFLEDESKLVRNEAIRAVYDTVALDGLAGKKLALLEPAQYSFYIQYRIVAANFRMGTDESAQRLLGFSSNPKIDKEIRSFSLRALMRWGMKLDTDPVLGHYRPMPAISSSMSNLTKVIGKDLRTFLLEENDPSLLSLATNLAQKAGLSIDEDILRKQIIDENLDPQVRVANLRSLAELESDQDNKLLKSLLTDKSEVVRATAFEFCLNRNLPEMDNLCNEAIKKDTLLVARKILDRFVLKKPDAMIELWQKRELELRPELWLDLYLFLSKNDHAESKKVAATYAAGEPARVHVLSIYGGDSLRGDKVFRNQGACMQCHQIDKEGGVQGPPLSLVGDRLSSDKLLESLVNPSAEITPGYGLSTVSTKEGITLVGRIAEESEDNATLVLISPDGKETQLKQEDISSISPPISAMPALGLTLAPLDLRDLIAFLKSRNKKELLAAKSSRLDSGHGKK
ncbi:MAG: HEAT repeat domain-containing protein [Opitutales bacterium]|nr:HEAT repeat domain-containing protein [Opitutales bacterium]